MNLKNTGRHTVTSAEDFEPDSNNTVLKNYLGIKSKEDIEAVEKQELERTELELLNIFDESHRFTSKNICDIHELWLGDIYPSAGRYRTVNMLKDGFLFATPTQIERLMQELEDKYLVEYTPCHYSDLDELAHAISVVHIELIVIHPFREGNGRTARLLADLMAMQARKSSLNYSSIDQTKNPEGFKQYILAIHAGVAGDYQPINKVFRQLLEESMT